MPEPKHTLSVEARYRLLKLLYDKPGLSQRELAATLEISLGKTNYCIRALIELGWVKVVNFHNSRHKIGYLYKLTPKGFGEKTRATRQFLKRKIEEYQEIEAEITALQQEMATLETVGPAQADQ
ncbi:MAG: MarR family EPS-associated transcriptional regulator [Gammaproteobacteria bacterium]|nr:MarR family EPS-associated transcriptional regulator [Gammaproteobacteria bacterium]